MNISITIQDIGLNCTASGFPIPSIYWFHNDTIVEESSRIKFATSSGNDFGSVSSELMILGAESNDTGLYRCQAYIDDRPIAFSDEALILVQGMLII